MRPTRFPIPAICILLAPVARAQPHSSDAAPASPSWGSLLLWAGVALLALWAASRLLPRLLASRARPTAAAAASPDPDDLRALARDLEELADRLAHRLDAKAERLERLLEQADQRLASLSDDAPDTYTPTPRPARRTATAPRLVPETAGDPATERIYALADSGASARDIAQQLDEPIGKVQLILALRG